MNIIEQISAQNPQDLAVVAVGLLVIFLWKKPSEAPIVIKKWHAKDVPDAGGHHIFIVGREAGLLSWLKALIGIDPTSTLVCGVKLLQFQTSSMAGTNTYVIPLEHLSAIRYGYFKPWKSAVCIFLFVVGSCRALFSTGVDAPSIKATLFSCVIGLVLSCLHYTFNRKVSLGFTEVSGDSFAITFKRSVIEGIDVDEDEARRVSQLLTTIMENKKSRALQSANAYPMMPRQ